MGPYTEAGDINLLVVTMANGTEAMLFNLFDTGATARARVSLKCGDGCATAHTETPVLGAIGKHTLSLVFPVGPGSTDASAVVDRVGMPLTVPSFVALPAEAKVEVRIGADQELKQTAPIEIRYEKLEIRFDPP